jgi:hypothetical protein
MIAGLVAALMFNTTLATLKCMAEIDLGEVRHHHHHQQTPNVSLCVLPVEPTW